MHVFFNNRSEGPAQVFLIVVTWLVAIFKDLPREEVKKKVISYDNMCHLNNLKASEYYVLSSVIHSQMLGCSEPVTTGSKPSKCLVGRAENYRLFAHIQSQRCSLQGAVQPGRIQNQIP